MPRQLCGWVLAVGSGVIAVALAGEAGCVFYDPIQVRAQTAGLVAPAGRRVYPRDESGTDPTFATFRSALLGAATRGDLAALQEAIAATPTINFEPSTRERVSRRFNLRQGVPWRALRDALTLGAVKEGTVDTFVAPYTSASESALKGDELIITARNVRVRQSPDSGSEVVEQLTYDVVTQGANYHEFDADLFERSDMPTGRSAWAHIVTLSGKQGYVYGRYVRSPIGRRFHFERQNGVWQIAHVTAGD